MCDNVRIFLPSRGAELVRDSLLRFGGSGGLHKGRQIDVGAGDGKQTLVFQSPNQCLKSLRYSTARLKVIGTSISPESSTKDVSL